MSITQSSELIRFISNIPVLNDGTVPLDKVEDEFNYQSYLYTPTYSLSVLARMTQDILNTSKIKQVDEELPKFTITRQMIDSDLSAYAPDMYLLTKIVVLESFSLVYHINEDKEKLRYVSKKDILRTRDNIQYIADFLGEEEKYRHMIETMRYMEISLGYLENQIDVIMSKWV